MEVRFWGEQSYKESTRKWSFTASKSIYDFIKTTILKQTTLTIKLGCRQHWWFDIPSYGSIIGLVKVPINLQASQSTCQSLVRWRGKPKRGGNDHPSHHIVDGYKFDISHQHCYRRMVVWLDSYHQLQVNQVLGDFGYYPYSNLSLCNTVVLVIAFICKSFKAHSLLLLDIGNEYHLAIQVCFESRSNIGSLVFS